MKPDFKMESWLRLFERVFNYSRKGYTMERLTPENQADSSGGKGGNLAVSEENVANNRTSEESEAGASFTDTGNILNEEVLVYTGLSIDIGRRHLSVPKGAPRKIGE